MTVGTGRTVTILTLSGACADTGGVYFSAEASFAGAAVVTGAGLGALALVKEKREVPFAALPLLFGIHQALEGLTWVALDGRPDARLSGFGVHS